MRSAVKRRENDSGQPFSLVRLLPSLTIASLGSYKATTQIDVPFIFLPQGTL